MFLKLVLIASGGASGALLRWTLAGVVQRAWGGTFPAGTLLVNLSGCLAIGVLMGIIETRSLPPALRDLLMIGLLGAFTTFSTFAMESLDLLRERHYFQAAANVLLSCALGLLLAWVGLGATKAAIRGLGLCDAAATSDLQRAGSQAAIDQPILQKVGPYEQAGD